MKNDSLIKMGFAENLVPLVKCGEKTLTYRLGDKYKDLDAGDIIETKDSSTDKVFAKLLIISKEVAIFKDLSIDRQGHEKYSSKEDQRISFEKYYPNKIEDDSK